MSSSTSLADFVSAIDKLDVRGKNWVSFKRNFGIAVRQKDVWDHFDGTSPRPVPADAAAPTAAESKALRDWNKAENTALYLLLLKIPEATLAKYESLATVALMWAAIKLEFQNKSLLARTTLRADFMCMRATPGADLHAEFDRVRAAYQELSNVGISISDGEYSSMLVTFLPSELSSFVSQLSATAKLAQRLNTTAQTTATAAAGTGPAADADKPVIAPDLLMELALEEWDRRQLDKKAKGKAKDPGVAAAALSSEKPKTKGRTGPRKPVGVCWTCGGKGHKQDTCPSPKKDKGAKDAPKPPAPGAPAGTGAVATASIVEVGSIAGAWAAAPVEDTVPLTRDAWSDDDDSVPESPSRPDADSPDDDDSLPELQSVSDTTESSDDDCRRPRHHGAYADTVEPTPPPPPRQPVPLSVRLAGIATWLEELPRPDEHEDAAPVNDATAAAVLPENAANAATSSQPVDLYDSGASHHMSPHREDFASLSEAKMILNAANQQTFRAEGVGEMVIPVPNPPGPDTNIRLKDVLYTPDLRYNLISVGRIDDAGFQTTFADGNCIIVDPEGQTVGRIPKTGGLYLVRRERDDGATTAAAATAPVVETLTEMEAHRRFAHIPIRAIRELVSRGFITGVKLVPSTEPNVCEACIRAKSTRKPVPAKREGERAMAFGDETHSDTWGPARVATLGGRKYYVSFTDDATRYSTVYLMRLKSETFPSYVSYEAWIETHEGVRLKLLNIDRGGEYLSDEFLAHLDSRGVELKLSVHDTHEHAGVSERLNRTVMEKVRAMLIASGLPRFLWGEALLHAIWLKNRTSTKALSGRTPYEALTGSPPDMSGIPVWGSQVWVHDDSSGKVGVRAIAARWVGFDTQSKGHRVYWPERRTVTVERNVRFAAPNLPAPFADDDAELEEEEEANTEDADSDNIKPALPAMTPSPPTAPPAASRPTRVRPPSQRVRDILEGKAADKKLPRGVRVQEVPEEEAVEELLMEEVDGIAMAAAQAQEEGLDPASLAEAKRRPEWPRWEEAMKEEMEALSKHGTWRLEHPPPGTNIVSCRWVFHAKKDASGNISRYRARLVARGFSQIPGTDFFDTYAPVAKTASIRTVLAFAARHDLEVHQVDVKSAYLNGEFDDNEVIYMSIPPGADLTDDPTLALRLLRPLYGLRQSARHWYKKLRQVLEELLDMKTCDVDQAVFYYVEGTDLIIIVVHVDDLTIAASCVALVIRVKAKLREAFAISDEGEIHWILGFAVIRDRSARTLSLSQTSYIEAIVRRFGLEDAKPLSTPMDPHVQLTAEQSPKTTAEVAEMRNVPYREAVGSLQYASLGTRPDITYAVSVLSRFLENPGRAHWEACKRVFRYLAGTKSLRLTYGGEQRDLVGFTDADGSMHDDRRAISGYAFLIDGAAVSWASKKQEIISLSTTESEYVAITHATKEALWLRSFIGQLFTPFTEAIELNSDNQSAIALTRDHQYHARTKHIDIRFHFIRWVVEDKKIKLVYCPTEDMVADVLTKALPSPKVKHFASALGLL
ncbi:transcription factor [Ganoderma sinense ZZ0214-1]|uniref:Transcription factor n=1 Tax=Ganoderma sinense ZZ0214-1 TaxID=1077348 RepID=A0A2G8SUK6_9APHY|nr:transcription factor [Ganoderma sinense ZZ0214-1]